MCIYFWFFLCEDVFDLLLLRILFFFEDRTACVCYRCEWSSGGFASDLIFFGGGEMQGGILSCEFFLFSSRDNRVIGCNTGGDIKL